MNFITVVFTDAWVMVEGSTLLAKTAELVILVHQILESVAGVAWEIVACPQEKSASSTHLLLWSASNILAVSLRTLNLCNGTLGITKNVCPDFRISFTDFSFR